MEDGFCGFSLVNEGAFHSVPSYKPTFTPTKKKQPNLPGYPFY